MALRVQSTIALTVYDTPSEDFKFFELSRTQQFDTFERYTSKKVAVAGLATEAVDLGDFAAVSGDEIRGLLVETDQDCTLSIDFGSGPVDIPLVRPGTATGNLAQFFMHGSPLPAGLSIVAGATALTAVVTAFGAPAS
jgi:hypothetical protein